MHVLDVFKTYVVFMGGSVVLGADGFDGLVEFVDFEADMFGIDRVLYFLDFLD